jgi:hypothetical protein
LIWYTKCRKQQEMLWIVQTGWGMYLSYRVIWDQPTLFYKSSIVCPWLKHIVQIQAFSNTLKERVVLVDSSLTLNNYLVDLDVASGSGLLLRSWQKWKTLWLTTKCTNLQWLLIILSKTIKSMCAFWYTVTSVNKDHSREPENAAFMCSFPLKIKKNKKLRYLWQHNITIYTWRISTLIQSNLP